MAQAAMFPTEALKKTIMNRKKNTSILEPRVNECAKQLHCHMPIHMTYTRNHITE